jgi:hypothetical protein
LNLSESLGVASLLDGLADGQFDLGMLQLLGLLVKLDSVARASMVLVARRDFKILNISKAILDF